MRLNQLNIARTTATLGLLALFPGFLLYHYSIAQGWIPPFLGGLFGVAATAMTISAIALAPWLARRGLDGALVTATMVVLMIVYMTAWGTINAVFLREEAYSTPALLETYATMASWIATLFVGACFGFASRRAKKALVISSVLIVLVLLHAMWRFKSPLGPYLTFRGDDTATGITSYQGIGRSIVITSVFLSAMLSGIRARVGLLATGCLLLMLVGSRTDTFTLAAVTIAVVGLVTVRGRNLGLSVAAVIVAGLLYYFLAPFFLSTRNAEILNLATSSSWQAREELQVIALKVIHDNPIIGDFGYHHRIGGSGFYAHNALSAWTNFGLLGFLLYVGTIAYFAVLSLRKLLGDLDNPAWFAAFLLNAAALMQAVFAVPVFSPLPALGWGVALNALRSPLALGVEDVADDGSTMAIEDEPPFGLTPAPIT